MDNFFQIQRLGAKYCITMSFWNVSIMILSSWGKRSKNEGRGIKSLGDCREYRTPTACTIVNRVVAHHFTSEATFGEHIFRTMRARIASAHRSSFIDTRRCYNLISTEKRAHYSITQHTITDVKFQVYSKNKI